MNVIVGINSCHIEFVNIQKIKFNFEAHGLSLITFRKNTCSFFLFSACRNAPSMQAFIFFKIRSNLIAQFYYHLLRLN